MNLIHLISGGGRGRREDPCAVSAQWPAAKPYRYPGVFYGGGPLPRRPGNWAIATVVMPGWNIPSICRHLVHRVRKENIDLVHCHGARANLVGCLMRRTLRVPVITTPCTATRNWTTMAAR